MVTLLVALSVMSVLASAAMPTWRQLTQREKEAELIFRGQQYARAIGLFQRRAGPGVNPPNIDVLVEQRFLRKKYKDPITGDDFDLISPVAQAAGAVAQQGRGGSPAGRGPTPPAAGRGQTAPAAGRGGQPSAFGAATGGGIVGVVSKSKEKSIRIYNGRSYYNEWQFVFVPQVQQPGGAAGPGGRGQRGVQPGPNQPGRGGMPPIFRGGPQAPGRGLPMPPGRGQPPPAPR